MADENLPATIRRGNRTLFHAPCPMCGRRSYRLKENVGRHCYDCAGIIRSRHRLSYDPLYRLWGKIKDRCYYPRTRNFNRYGGRGIYVCAEWLNDPAAFINWAKAHGWQRGLHIHRVNNDGPYSPDNCRFVTHLENNRERPCTELNEDIVARIKRMILSGMTNADIARKLDITKSKVENIKYGNSWRDVRPAQDEN
jgi:hypothetical protein